MFDEHGVDNLAGRQEVDWNGVHGCLQVGFIVRANTGQQGCSECGFCDGVGDVCIKRLLVQAEHGGNGVVSMSGRSGKIRSSAAPNSTRKIA